MALQPLYFHSVARITARNLLDCTYDCCMRETVVTISRRIIQTMWLDSGCFDSKDMKNSARNTGIDFHHLPGMILLASNTRIRTIGGFNTKLEVYLYFFER